MDQILPRDAAIPIPVIFVAAHDFSIESYGGGLTVVSRMNPSVVIARRGIVEPATEVAIVDIRDCDRRDVVICGLFLRNAGRTVVICDVRKIPVDLVRDVHNFSVKEKAGGRLVRTEVLVMEEAMEVLGDISDVVAYFEKEFLGH